MPDGPESHGPARRPTHRLWIAVALTLLLVAGSISAGISASGFIGTFLHGTSELRPAEDEAVPIARHESEARERTTGAARAKLDSPPPLPGANTGEAIAPLPGFQAAEPQDARQSSPRPAAVLTAFARAPPSSVSLQ